MLHLHVRDAAGAHTLDAAAYRSAIGAVRGAVGDKLIVQVTTEAVGRYSAAEQMALVRELCPEAVSIALRELIPDDAAEAAAAEFLAWTVGAGIGVQYILYAGDEAPRLDEPAQTTRRRRPLGARGGARPRRHRSARDVGSAGRPAGAVG